MSDRHRQYNPRERHLRRRSPDSKRYDSYRRGEQDADERCDPSDRQRRRSRDRRDKRDDRERSPHYADRGGRSERPSEHRTGGPDFGLSGRLAGGRNDDSDAADPDAPPPMQPNFELSGKLAAETNTFKGVVLKYNEPMEARKPERQYRLYVFKGKEEQGRQTGPVGKIEARIYY